MVSYAVHRKSINWKPKSINWIFDRFEKTAKNQNANQDRVNREQEHQELYWFTLSQELHPVSFPTSREIHSRTQSSSNTNNNTLASCKKPSAPCRISPLNPTENTKPVQNAIVHLQT